MTRQARAVQVTAEGRGTKGPLHASLSDGLLAELSARDLKVLEALWRASAAANESRIRPAEGATLRAIVVLSAPIWLTAIAIMAIGRAARRQLPIILLHERCGFEGDRLLVPKIATLQVSGNRRLLGGTIEVATGPPVEAAVDSRSDAFLRRSGLDELPQLALIAIGKMRLIGPRPVTPSELAEMTTASLGARPIDRLQPGLIGVWQVLDRHAYELDQRDELDRWMLQRWSPGLSRRIAREALRQAWRHRAVPRGAQAKLAERQGRKWE